MTDPASVTVTIGIAGLSLTEASQVLTSLRPGRSMTFTASQHPGERPRRFHVSANDFSLSDVEAAVTDLIQHLNAVAAGGRP